MELVTAPCPPAFKGKYILDDKNNPVPAQKLSDGNICFFAHVPARGKRTYHVDPDESMGKIKMEPGIDWTMDTVTGAVRSVKTYKISWIDATAPFGLFQALYVPGRNPDHYVTTKCTDMDTLENGPLIQTIRMTSTMEGAESVVYEISRTTIKDRIKCTIYVDKKAIRDKESLHIALPFDLTKPVVRIGLDDGFYKPSSEQTPGANKDFFSVQRWIDVSGSGKGVTVSCPQGGLFEIGEMVNEEQVNHGYKKWKSTYKDDATLFVYLMNNYWHTNYKADQEGVVKIDLYLRFHQDFNATAAYRFGMESTRPLIVVSRKS